MWISVGTPDVGRLPGRWQSDWGMHMLWKPQRVRGWRLDLPSTSRPLPSSPILSPLPCRSFGHILVMRPLSQLSTSAVECSLILHRNLPSPLQVLWVHHGHEAVVNAGYLCSGVLSFSFIASCLLYLVRGGGKGSRGVHGEGGEGNCPRTVAKGGGAPVTA